MQDFYHLAIIWTGVLLSTFLARWTKLTPVLYFLAFGSLSATLGVLPHETTPFIHGFAEIGIVLIMFALGFEENPARFVSGIRRAWGIAFFGAVAPFFTAYFVAIEYWGETRLAMMCGLAMTATAVSLTMVSLRSENLHTSEAARGIMTSAVLDDIASLALVAVLVPLATGDAEPSVRAVVVVVGKAAVFFGIVAVLGMWIMPHEPVTRWVRRIPVVRSYGMRHLLMLGESSTATLIVLLLALLVGILAHHFGFHPAVGAYMAGLILKQEYFHHDKSRQAAVYNQTKHIVDDVAFSWIGPVFFVNLGTKIVLDYHVIGSLAQETFVMTAGLIVAQVASAALAARFTGRFQWHESMMIGFGMLGRAELAFVVMDIGYVENDIFSPAAFYTLMFSAFWLNVSVPLSIRLWKPYYTGDKELAVKIGGRRILLSRPLPDG